MERGKSFSWAPIPEPAFHRTLKALCLQHHIWVYLYLAREVQPRGPDDSSPLGCCLGWLGRKQHSVRSGRWRDCSSADVFHGRRSKQPSPSHLELTAESVGCLHTLQHGYSPGVGGPLTTHRDQHLIPSDLWHMVSLSRTTKTFNHIGWVKNIS